MDAALVIAAAVPVAGPGANAAAPGPREGAAAPGNDGDTPSFARELRRSQSARPSGDAPSEAETSADAPREPSPTPRTPGRNAAPRTPAATHATPAPRAKASAPAQDAAGPAAPGDDDAATPRPLRRAGDADAAVTDPAALLRQSRLPGDPDATVPQPALRAADPDAPMPTDPAASGVPAAEAAAPTAAEAAGMATAVQAATTPAAPALPPSTPSADLPASDGAASEVRARPLSRAATHATLATDTRETPCPPASRPADGDPRLLAAEHLLHAAPVPGDPSGPGDERLAATSAAGTGTSPGLFAGELTRLLSTPGAAAAAAAPTPTELRLLTPVDAPEFVPRLSSEIAVLARDGVQEARVQVHPVELGPIDVRISVDGSAAQVHLAVDSLHTRTLLESAMPALAGAMRDNGLTLTGGGVFEQSRQGDRQTGADDADGRRGSTRRDDAAADAGTAPAAPARRLRAARALDLYV
ncbi:MAG: flagellar hook-length control protein FliK [Rubrivivax sp.]